MVSPQSTAIVCNSATVAEYIARVYGAPPDRATVIYNGVDLDRFQPHTNGNGNGNGASHPPTIGAICRVTAQKNPGLFLAAAASLLERRPDCRFVVVGDGDGLPGAKQEAARLGIEHAVSFLGARSDVKDKLIELGVDPFDAQKRIAGLSDSDVKKLNDDIQKATVAGDVAGILIVVLLVILIIYFAKRI